MGWFSYLHTARERVTNINYEAHPHQPCKRMKGLDTKLSEYAIVQTELVTQQFSR